MMLSRLSRVSLLLATAAACAACASTGKGYLQDPMALAAPEQPAQDDRQMYLELIAKMQQQGAYFASLAHVDAYRQRYGDAPRLRLLQADALRGTDQLQAAQTLYASLTNGPQAGAAWHGLGLIAARNGDAARAEQALARAVQLQPLSTDYLGDLGFARLRAGQWAQAREPLAKAAELAPGNPKANANLAIWALVRGQTDMAETIMRNGRLTEAAQAEVRRLAQQLRSEARAAPAEEAVSPPARDAAATARQVAPVPAPPAAPARAAQPMPRQRDADGTRIASARDARVAPSMLERFSASHPARETTP